MNFVSWHKLTISKFNTASIRSSRISVDIYFWKGLILFPDCSHFLGLLFFEVVNVHFGSVVSDVPESSQNGFGLREHFSQFFLRHLFNLDAFNFLVFMMFLVHSLQLCLGKYQMHCHGLWAQIVRISWGERWKSCSFHDFLYFLGNNRLKSVAVVLIELVPPGMPQLFDSIKLISHILDNICKVVQLNVNLDKIPFNNFFQWYAQK